MAGNRIGTDVTGTVAIPNAGYGVSILAGSGNQVGRGGGLENVISGNQLGGVVVAADDTDVVLDKIGTDATGTSALGNGGPGVLVSANDTKVNASVIAHNGGAGVWIVSGEGNGRTSIPFDRTRGCLSTSAHPGARRTTRRTSIRGPTGC